MAGCGPAALGLAWETGRGGGAGHHHRGVLTNPPIGTLLHHLGRKFISLDGVGGTHESQAQLSKFPSHPFWDVECLPSLGPSQGLWFLWFMAMLASFDGIKEAIGFF